MAKFVQQKFQSAGLDAKIEPVPALLSYPLGEAPTLQLVQAESEEVVYHAGNAFHLYIFFVYLPIRNEWNRMDSKPTINIFYFNVL